MCIVSLKKALIQERNPRNLSVAFYIDRSRTTFKNSSFFCEQQYTFILEKNPNHSAECHTWRLYLIKYDTSKHFNELLSPQDEVLTMI